MTNPTWEPRRSRARCLDTELLEPTFQRKSLEQTAWEEKKEENGSEREPNHEQVARGAGEGLCKQVKILTIFKNQVEMLASF